MAGTNLKDEANGTRLSRLLVNKGTDDKLQDDKLHKVLEEINVSVTKILKTSDEIRESIPESTRELQKSLAVQTKEIKEAIVKKQSEPSSQSDVDENLLIQKLCKFNFDSDVKNSVRSFHPGTRELLLKKVEDWFSKKESNMFVLTAGPGVGKTVLAAKIVCVYREEKQSLAAYHLCKFNNTYYSNPSNMIESLASQLCDSVKGFKTKLLEQLKRGNKVENLHDAFQVYLKEPLSQLPENKPMLLVIDGLDECQSDERTELLDVLAKEFSTLPFWLKVLVTSRPEINVKKKLSSLEYMEILPKDRNNEDDIKRYLTLHLPALSKWKSFISRVAEECEGSFLYAFHLQEYLQKRPPISQLPQELSSVYHEYFSRLRKELEAVSKKYDIFHLLEIIAAAHGPIPLSFITELGLDRTRMQDIIGKVNENISTLLFVNDDLVTVFHKSVVDWLKLTGDKTHEYTVDCEHGNEFLWKMSKFCFEEIKANIVKQKDLSIIDELKESKAMKYALENGFKHLPPPSAQSSWSTSGDYEWLVDVALYYDSSRSRKTYYTLRESESWKEFRHPMSNAQFAAIGRKVCWYDMESEATKDENTIVQDILNSSQIFSDEDKYIAKMIRNNRGNLESRIGEYTRTDVSFRTYTDAHALEKPEEISENEINKARSLALEFMSANPCCVRAIPYANDENQSLTMRLYVDTDGKGIPKNVEDAAQEMFADYQFDDLQRRPLSKIITRLPSSQKQKDKEISDLSRTIEKNLHVFENRLNVTAVQASYKVVNSIEQDTPCVKVFVLGKRRVPAGETDFKEIKQLNGCPFDVAEGYYQPTSASSRKSFAFPLEGGVGIGVQGVRGAGTLGGFLEDEDGKIYILSNQHVLHPPEVDNITNNVEMENSTNEGEDGAETVGGILEDTDNTNDDEMENNTNDDEMENSTNEGAHGAGNVGGLLEDTDNTSDVVMERSTNNITIVQPAESDYKDMLDQAETDLDHQQSQKLTKLSASTQEDMDELKNDKYFRPIVESIENEIEKAKTNLKEIADKEPRTIGKNVLGLQGNVEVRLEDKNFKFYVDAAIAELDEDQLQFMKRFRRLEKKETDLCPLYGFQKNKVPNWDDNIWERYRPNGETADLEVFVKQLRTHDLKPRFMKIDTEGMFVNRISANRDGTCASVFSNVEYLYCNDCMHSDSGEREILQKENMGWCAKCEKKLDKSTLGSVVKSIWLHNCFVIRRSERPFCDRGDSGSLIFGNDGRAWGLVHGIFKSSDVIFCLASPFSVTLKALEDVKAQKEVSKKKELNLWTAMNTSEGSTSNIQHYIQDYKEYSGVTLDDEYSNMKTGDQIPGQKINVYLVKRENDALPIQRSVIPPSAEICGVINCENEDEKLDLCADIVEKEINDEDYNSRAVLLKRDRRNEVFNAMKSKGVPVCYIGQGRSNAVVVDTPLRALSRQWKTVFVIGKREEFLDNYRAMTRATSKLVVIFI